MSTLAPPFLPWPLVHVSNALFKIIATAIPKITDDFHSLNDIGWYGSAYLLTTCAFQLLFGKIYALFPVKWVFLTCLGVFEIGSLVCGVAPTSKALIVGRAVAGLGSAGLFSGALITVAYSTPMEKRSAYIGLIGGMYGIASVAGPLVRCPRATFEQFSSILIRGRLAEHSRITLRGDGVFI